MSKKAMSKKAMSKKVMVVGTGFGQLPMIDACRKMGLNSIGVDYNKNSIGANLVDSFFHKDIKDTDSILEIAKKEQIDACVTMQSDLPVITIGAINQELDLSGVTLETAIICSNKDLTRVTLQKNNITQPKFLITKNLEEGFLAVKEIGYPCIIKAPDSSGSRGVTKVSFFADIENAYREATLHSRSGKIIVEEFINGIEIGAQTFSQGGECTYCLIHNDTLSDNGSMVPTGHSYPFSQVAIDRKKVTEEISKALCAVGLMNGPANIDLIVTEIGDVNIIEIGARIGATCLPELTTAYTGIDWTRLTIMNALGIRHSKIDLKKQPCAAYILQAPQSGILTDIRYNFDPKDYKEYNPQIEITARIGDRVEVLQKGTDRIGRILVEAKTVEEAEEIVKYLISKVEFIVKYDG